MPEDISRYYTDLLDDDLVTDWHWFTNDFRPIHSLLGTQLVSLHVSQWRNQHYVAT
jgi:hypothetical protein